MAEVPTAAAAKVVALVGPAEAREAEARAAGVRVAEGRAAAMEGVRVAEARVAEARAVARAVVRAVVTEVGSGTVAVVSQRQAAPLAVELLRS